LRLFIISETLPLPEFLYKNGYGCIISGALGDTDVSDQWEKWLEEIFGDIN
jgi:hypothetical protein